MFLLYSIKWWIGLSSVRLNGGLVFLQFDIEKENCQTITHLVILPIQILTPYKETGK